MFVRTPGFQVGPLRFAWKQGQSGEHRKTTFPQDRILASKVVNSTPPLFTIETEVTEDMPIKERRNLYDPHSNTIVSCQPIAAVSMALPEMYRSIKRNMFIRFTGTQLTQASVHDGSNAFYVNARNMPFLVTTTMTPMDTEDDGMFYMHPLTLAWMDAHPATELACIVWATDTPTMGTKTCLELVVHSPLTERIWIPIGNARKTNMDTTIDKKFLDGVTRTENGVTWTFHLRYNSRIASIGTTTHWTQTPLMSANKGQLGHPTILSGFSCSPDRNS